MKTISQPVSAFQFGLLTTLDMVTAILVYIPVGYLVDRSTKKPFVLITFVFFTLFPLVLLFSRSLPWLILAFILRGLKEFGEPNGWLFTHQMLIGPGLAESTPGPLIRVTQFVCSLGAWNVPNGLAPFMEAVCRQSTAVIS